MATTSRQVKPATMQLIGTRIEVIDAKNASLNGIDGTVVDETRNTMTIQTKSGNTKLIKEQVTIRLGQRVIPGQQLRGRPEERIKKAW